MYRYALRHERIVLKYERVAFLIPCQGLQGLDTIFFTNFQYTYLFSVLAYCACVFPVIIHAGSLFFALRHVFSDLLHILNFDIWIIRMCFLLFCTYLILVFELSACISWFFAHTRFLFLTSAHVFQIGCLNNWDVFHKPAEKDCSPGRRCGGDCEIFLESGWSTGATRTRCSR